MGYCTRMLACAALLLALLASPCLCFQTRLVMASDPSPLNPLVVNSPEVSRIFFAELGGSPEYYTLCSDEAFTLSARILVPDMPEYGGKRISVNITDSYGQLLFMLDSGQAEWEEFHEPFGDDYYLRGPGIVKYVPPGNYTLSVFSDDNSGRYAMVIGSREELPAEEIVNTLLSTPQIKRDFFGKGLQESFMNYSGLFFSIAIFIIAISSFFIIKFSWKKIERK